MSFKATIGGSKLCAALSSYKYSFNLDDFLSDVQTKTLFKVGVIGNSNMANLYGGANDIESTGEKPPKGGYSNVPRRLYDDIVANFSTPYFRRIDHTDWTRSILGGGDDFTEITGNEVVRPDWVNATNGTLYAYCQQASGYAEIDIPDGYENFAIILHKDNNEFTQDYDDNVSVTINGGDILSYGASAINTYKAKLNGFDYGNPLYTELYESLPAGINTIRITKSNTAKTLMLWGVVYWTGNSMILYNHGMGGWDMDDYYDSTRDSVTENDYDAIFFQITGMTEASHGNTLNQTQTNLENWIAFLDSKDVLYYSSHPFGDDGAGTNYYTLYTNPNLEEIYQRCRKVLLDADKPYLNVFKRFKDLIVYQGGTLEGGEGGLLYTTDGQHPNTDGTVIFTNYIINQALAGKL